MDSLMGNGWLYSLGALEKHLLLGRGSQPLDLDVLANLLSQKVICRFIIGSFLFFKQRMNIEITGSPIFPFIVRSHCRLKKS
ncbi:hypothetical protein Ahy_B02g057413 isoform E [Arachis hypogaea]|uniref:Uncharacterized protein n=1 Tax=Arachis hypogaea TaxID=3818 RepID=A0A445ACB3_ARAHY|nr:hypothetical protein Ahy_B02g057413 isoform E [Arachis hypogaea]